MEGARVIIIEDDPRLRQGVRVNLEARDHRIVGEAGTVDEAVELVDSLTSDDVDIAVVDGNLSHEAEGGFEGERIANLIHEKLPGVVVVGCSLDGGVRGSDKDIRKGDSWGMDAFVTSLPNREPI